MSDETKVCPGCGLVVKSYAKYCAECGSYIPDPNEEVKDEVQEAPTQENVDFTVETATQSSYNTNFAYGVMSKKDYFNTYADKNTKSAINTAGILCFILAGISLPGMIMLLMSGDMSFGIGLLLDIAVYIGLGIGAYTKKSKGCILAASIYYGLGSLLVIGSLPIGTMIMRIAITAGLIYGYVKANQFDQQYKYYLWELQNRNNNE